MNGTQTLYQYPRGLGILPTQYIALFAAPVRAEMGFSSGVAAGDVSSSGAILWTRADLPGRVRLEVAGEPAFASIVIRSEADATEERDLTVSFDVTGLNPRTTYYYRFARGDDPVTVSRSGRFRTAPADDASADARFVFSGDTNFAYAPFGVVASLAREEADAFIWFGDTIYADVPAGGLGVARSLAEYRAK